MREGRRYIPGDDDVAVAENGMLVKLGERRIGLSTYERGLEDVP